MSAVTGGRRTIADIDRQVEMLAKAYSVAVGEVVQVSLYREGASWRLTVAGYGVTTWGKASPTVVWESLLDMRRAVEAVHNARSRMERERADA